MRKTKHIPIDELGEIPYSEDFPGVAPLLGDTVQRILGYRKKTKHHRQCARPKCKELFFSLDPRRAYCSKACGTFMAQQRRREAGVRNRAIRKNAPGAHTEEEWQRKFAEYRNCCGYCWKWLEMPTKHHVVPLARGGTDDISNIVPACLSCNCSIGTKVVLPNLHRLELAYPARGYE